MKHILKGNSSFFRSITDTKDPLQKLLESGIECQFFEHSPSSLELNFTNVTLKSSTDNECTWIWIQDGANAWDGQFNITLHETQDPQEVNDSDRKQLQSIYGPGQDVMMALTCWLPSSSKGKYSSAGANTLMQKIQIIGRKSMKEGKLQVATKLGVTFAAPFILRKYTNLTKKQIHPAGTVIVDPNTTIAILAVTISFVLFVVVVVVAYRLFKRSKDKR